MKGMRFDVQVQVRLRDGVSDPEGATIERSLPALGFDGVSGVGVGKVIHFTLDADSEATARAEVTDMCERFLTNPVIEQSDITITEANETAAASA